MLVAISVYTLYDKSFIKELLGTNLFTGAVYILIVTGVLLSFLSFLGCAGAVKEVKCMLLTVRTRTLGRNALCFIKTFRTKRNRNNAFFFFLHVFTNTLQLYKYLTIRVAVFHHTVYNIHRHARRRDSVLRVPPKSTDYHAARDAQDY